MPSAAPRPCTMPGCGTLVTTGGGRCDKHQRQPWVKPSGSPARITGRRLQEMRRELFRRDPLCAMCMRGGIITLATQRDHIIPLSEGGSDTIDNTQGLCDAHHAEKSLAERLRGRGIQKSG